MKEKEKINFWQFYSKLSKRNKIFIKKKFGNNFQLKKDSVSSVFARKVLNFEEVTYLCELIRIDEDEFSFDKPLKTKKI